MKRAFCTGIVTIAGACGSVDAVGVRSVPDAGGAGGATLDAAIDAPEDAATDVVDESPVDAAPDAVRDPTQRGPYSIRSFDARPVLSSGGAQPIHCELPASGSPNAPYPLVGIAHGFQLEPSRYYGYARRLASFGYVACTLDYPSSLLGNDNPEQADTLSAGIDWLLAESGKSTSELSGSIDRERVGMMGHSLGGKLALYVGARDVRIKASFALDPVDGGGPAGCSAPACVDVSALMPQLRGPSGFLGELTDSTGLVVACAPKADNFETFHALAPAPSFAVTINGANHMSFLDDTRNCTACATCQRASRSNAEVTAIAYAYTVAFYERHLRGIGGYDAWLTGAEARRRWVDANVIGIQSK